MPPPKKHQSALPNISNLSIIDTPSTPTARLKKKEKAAVADSWEDEASDGGDDDGVGGGKPALPTPEMVDTAKEETQNNNNNKKKQKKNRIDKDKLVDSWELESSGDSDSGHETQAHKLKPTLSRDYPPHAHIQPSSPPRKPSREPLGEDNPQTLFAPDGTPLSSPSPSTPSTSSRRQPTTDAVARRLISSALGIRAPRATQEQREYESTMKAQLRKKREHDRDEERRRAEEVERRKKEVWGD